MPSLPAVAAFRPFQYWRLAAIVFVVLAGFLWILTRLFDKHGYEVAVRHLGGEECPLPADDRRRAWNRLKQHHARRILRTVFRQLRPRTGWRVFRASGLTWGELARGLRPYDGVGGGGR